MYDSNHEQRNFLLGAFNHYTTASSSIILRMYSSLIVRKEDDVSVANLENRKP